MVSKTKTQMKGILFGREPESAMEDREARVEASFQPGMDGAGTLRLRYRGSLIDQHPPIWVRFGERRNGKDWVGTRDVPMIQDRGEAMAKIVCGPGAPIEGACFAFYAGEDREGSKQVWDSGGRPYGYYALDAKTGQIATR